jgi:hypothetical protein
VDELFSLPHFISHLAAAKTAYQQKKGKIAPASSQNVQG